MVHIHGLEDISKWGDSSPDKTSILFCYSLGKAQRLLNEISKSNFKNNIYTHSSINKINWIWFFIIIIYHLF